MISDAGSSAIRISELGLALLMPSDNQEFALKAKESLDHPKIFQLLDSQFGDSGSVDSIAAILIRSHGFNDAAARDCAKSYKDSINYVRSLPGFSENHHQETNTEEAPKTNTSVINDNDTQQYSTVPDKERYYPENSEHKTGKLSERTKIEVIVTGPLGIDEEAKLQVWIERVLNKWLENKAANDQFNEDEF
ncbi:MAG: hypothetical protein QM758_15370 [Armatimonas sp.]